MANTPVYVVAKYDFIENGVVRVARGTEGTVLTVSEPPALFMIQVRFTGGGSSEDIWVNLDQVTFRDGAIGPLRAVLQGRAVVLTDVRYPYLLSTRDLVIDNRLTYAGNMVDLITDDGYTIRITSNANNDIAVSYLLTSTIP